MIVDMDALDMDARPVDDEDYVRPRDRRPTAKPGPPKPKGTAGRSRGPPVERGPSAGPRRPERARGARADAAAVDRRRRPDDA